MRRDLPTGTVTFLFTDVEGSTRLLHELGAEGYAEALAEHRRVIREACAAEGGVEVDTQGDAFFFAFPTADGALQAATVSQQGLSPGHVRVRIGLHTGSPLLTDEGYVGDDVHFAARVAAAGHGGQVILSRATAELVSLELIDLGEHRLKDIPEAVPIYQLGNGSFPPLKTISNTNLPRPASSFVGREREVSEVVSQLRGRTRLVTLSGPGGSGKTRLAIEAASELVPDFKAGVFWVGLAPLRDPALVTETIAQTLGAKDGLTEHIAEREMLLLLDNLEQVIDCAPELGLLLEACPNLKLLVTSRELLRVRGEVEYAVPPLAEPEAVALFCERAQLEPDETIAELCRRLDDLPLAVELAAARTSVLTPRQILDRLSQRLDLLKGGRDAEARQRTLRATIEWSYDLLTPEEQQLFARLSVFAGGCTLAAGEEVAGADLDTLQSLVVKSLLRFTDGRYWMLETIREYAAERLDAVDADRLLELLAEYLLALAAKLGAPLFFERDQPEAYARLDAEHGNARAAMEWALRAGRWDMAMDLIGQLGIVMVARGHVREVEGWVDASLDHRHAVSAHTRARALIVSSDVMKAARRPDRVAEFAEELVETMAGDPEVDQLWVAAAMVDLSDGARERGDSVQARTWGECSIEFRIANDLPAARALMALGALELQEGHLDRAERSFQRAADELRGRHEANYANSLMGAAEAALLRGAHVLATERIAEALRAYVSLGDQGAAGTALQALARVASDEGRLERAGTLWGAGLALLQEWGAAPEQGVPEPRVNSAAIEAGAVMSLDEAVEYALASLD